MSCKSLVLSGDFQLMIVSCESLLLSGDFWAVSVAGCVLCILAISSMYREYWNRKKLDMGESESYGMEQIQEI